MLCNLVLVFEMDSTIVRSDSRLHTDLTEALIQ
jgi:hypothetical protein